MLISLIREGGGRNASAAKRGRSAEIYEFERRHGLTLIAPGKKK
jgi:hypothetical protein